MKKNRKIKIKTDNQIEKKKSAEDNKKLWGEKDIIQLNLMFVLDDIVSKIMSKMQLVSD